MTIRALEMTIRVLRMTSKTLRMTFQYEETIAYKSGAEDFDFDWTYYPGDRSSSNEGGMGQLYCL